uniref:Oxidored_FMN domain-containing protein n=2 Tax=Bursaphelenchus xylophilus TaxID=6326 RepID=A0A1I7RMH8_BURXY
MAKHFDELGFDFIELTGGNLEAARMGHVKESTKKREAYFIEFAGAIKPNIQNAAIYLTGGFRTAPAMVAAIRNNETDGIGLARPAAAEPDLPKKIINHGVQSCAATIFADDFMISMPAANTQLAQAGSSDVSECHGDLCHGISDFSNPDEAETYKNAMFKWFGELCEAGSKGRAEIGVFEYHTRSKNAPHEHKGFIRRLLESI